MLSFFLLLQAAGMPCLGSKKGFHDRTCIMNPSQSKLTICLFTTYKRTFVTFPAVKQFPGNEFVQWRHRVSIMDMQVRPLADTSMYHAAASMVMISLLQRFLFFLCRVSTMAMQMLPL